MTLRSSYLLFMSVMVLASKSDALDVPADVVGRYQAVFPNPPTQIPNDSEVNAPLMGNGNMLAALGGPANLLRFYINRSDQWLVPSTGTTSGPRPLARLDLSLTNMSGATYNVTEDFLHGLVTGQFTKSGVK